MSDHRRCERCADIGIVDGDYCTCPVGIAATRAPKIHIRRAAGSSEPDITLVFPPGTSNEDAQAVFEEAKRCYLELFS